MKTPLRTLIGVLAATLMVGLTTIPAGAITGGEPDGEGHPNVALIVFYRPDGRFRCTATLASPTVLITAAHCTAGNLGKAGVTFQSVIAEQPPDEIPVAANPAVGYTSAELNAAGYLSGTAFTHPAYSNFTDLKNWNDVGVIVLDAPITGVQPASLTPLNYLNQFKDTVLRKTLFTVVGYGNEVRKLNGLTGKPTPMRYPLLRRTTEEPGQKLTPQILQTNSNEKDPFGGGGTCFGDSGGPVFKNGYIVADTSYGYTNNCRYISGYQRLDIPVVQNWLATFGLEPAA